MTEPTRSDEQHLAAQAEMCCENALHIAHAFLRGELADVSAAQVRAHLMSCEHCMDDFDAEMLITQLVRRSVVVSPAPVTLRTRIVQMHVSWES